MLKVLILWILILLSTFHPLNAQKDSVPASRKKILVAGTTVLWTTSTIGLYSLWYKDYPSTTFHTFNDNAEWLQMDKAGHFVTANITGSLGYTAFRWAGYDEKKALWIGGSLGWLFLTTIEVMDGFNSQWGFSWGDMICNTAGSLSFILQQQRWKEQPVMFKASFHATSLAGYRPDLLGEQWYEEVLKDYNGQTYWVCVNPASITGQSIYIPKWLNIALGYSAYGMLGGRTNPGGHNGQLLPQVDRYRRYFLSPDLSLSRLPFKNRTLIAICKTLDFIKLPLPALEYNKKKGFIFHPLYF